jgi:signal transduction histidine kinase
VVARKDRLITAVIDTGIGMKYEDLQRLFKFFGKLQMTKMINRGGMGLGLTISKMIVKELGGDIQVSSTQGLGSEFTF